LFIGDPAVVILRLTSHANDLSNGRAARRVLPSEHAGV